MSIDTFIGILSLCATMFGLGYTIGKNHSNTQK